MVKSKLTYLRDVAMNAIGAWVNKDIHARLCYDILSLSSRE